MEQGASSARSVGALDSEQLAQENIMLLQKLQAAENELQAFRASGAARQQSPAKGGVDSNSQILDTSSQHQDDMQRLQQLEMQLVGLKKSLRDAKEEVLDAITEQFQKRFRELRSSYTKEHVMKAKLSELKTQQQLEVVLNNNVRVIKEFSFVAPAVQTPETSSPASLKRLIVVQALSNNECYVVDEAKLSEAESAFVRSYIPPAAEEEESTVESMRAAARQMERLEEQLRDIREERQELNAEVLFLKEKLTQQPGDKDAREIDLEDENAHLTAENMELRMKLKQLAE